MDGTDFVQLKLDMDDDLVELADEISDRLFDILTTYQDVSMKGADIEILGGVILQEFVSNVNGLFQDRYYDLSDKVDGNKPIVFTAEEEEVEEDDEDEEEGIDSEVSDDVTEIPDE